MPTNWSSDTNRACYNTVLQNMLNKILLLTIPPNMTVENDCGKYGALMTIQKLE